MKIFSIIIEFLKNLFKFKKENELPDARHYDLRKCKSWGDSIIWSSFDRRSVMGHQYKIPRVGDYLVSEMTSGVLYKFKFVIVDQMRDPPDMFSGTVVDVGVCDENYELIKEK